MDLMRYAAELEGVDFGSMPPVKSWHPDLSGDLDLVIQRDGTWIHEGSPIKRSRLVRLFSTVLRREGDEYFLVTPVEKYRIRVEDVPFVAVALQHKIGSEDAGNLQFMTNVGDRVVAGADNEIFFQQRGEVEHLVPYLHIREGLNAIISRSVYYELVEFVELRRTNGIDKFGVWSKNCFFPFPTENSEQ